MPISPVRRRPVAWIRSVVRVGIWLGLAVAGVDRVASGQTTPAKPAKADSRVEAKPKEVQFEVAVGPKSAKPGDVVTYSITAKISPDWHIYGYSKMQPEEGPRVTSFDFFDKAGLKVEGEWTASVEPTREKDPAFPELPFVAYHENEVTWSLKLKIPKDASPGKKPLRCQSAFQICSHSSCSFPGQWTLPSAELTVEGSTSKPPLVDASPKEAQVDTAVKTASIDGASPQPKAKDSRANLRPKEAEITASLSVNEAVPGGTVLYTVKVKLAPGWHIYKYAKTEADDGPAYTIFDLFQPGGLIPQGDWMPATAPIKKKEPAFQNIEFLEFYEGEASWSISLKVPDDAKPGEAAVASQVSYQICDAKSCQRLTRWTMPAVALKILPAGSKVALVPATAAKIETKGASKPPAEEIKLSPSVEAPAVAGLNDGQKNAGIGLLTFLLWSAGGGLAALVMPCVWPMIPITVNFFVKQGQKNKGRTTPLALAYCFSIIGIFTGMGVLFSVFFGASAISKLANNAWLNFGVAALFLAFGFSLLGLFEIRLPNFLLNASSHGEGKGGLVGVMFMALTLTITSFTCTFPVVGALVVMAASGSYLYPTIGLLTFSTVLALPFLLLALSPDLLSKMPKSGDWMNTVKVVGGLVEIGAAFKFVNTAECSLGAIPSDAWFNASAVLAIWIVLAAVCGIYLLGLFRTDHDQEEAKVGPGRMMLGVFFLFLAVYLAPALFGNPPKGPIYGRLIVGILPADAGDLDLTTRLALMVPSSGSGEIAQRPRVTKATSTDPAIAEREQTSFHGVVWGMSYDAAVERAKLEKKPILIDFTGVNCANCRLMEQRVLPRPEIVKLMEQFVTVQLYTDFAQIDSLNKDQKEKLGEKNLDLELKFTKATTNPYYVIITPDGEVIGAKGGYYEPSEFQAFLSDGMAKFQGGAKVVSGR